MRRIRQGKWVGSMSDEEWEIYLGSCDLLGLGVKPRLGGTVGEAPTNVVQLHKDNVNRGGIVPEGGAAAEDGDHRKRYRMKYAGRLGKRWSEIIQAVQNGEHTWSDFVETLSPEELARGQLKDKNGTFLGRPPAFVPRAFHDACIRELLARGKVLYKENYVKAIQAMTDIANSPTAKESDRIKAATFVIERLEGKVPERVEISAADPWQQIISGIIAEVDEEEIANAQAYLSRMEEGANDA